MTIEEMKELSKSLSLDKFVIGQDINAHIANKLSGNLWACCAEICERLDKIIEQQINKPVFITKYDPPKIGSSD